jgi:hypothetical protein
MSQMVTDHTKALVHLRQFDSVVGAMTRLPIFGSVQL